MDLGRDVCESLGELGAVILDFSFLSFVERPRIVEVDVLVAERCQATLRMREWSEGAVEGG